MLLFALFGFGLTKLIPYLVYGGVIGLALLSLVRPRIGVLGTIPLLPFRVVIERLHEFPLGKDTVDILFLCIIAGYALEALRGGAPRQGPTPWLVRVMQVEIVFLFLSLFVGAMTFHLGNPIDLGDSRFVNLKNHLMLPILFLLTFRAVRDRRDVKIVLFLMVVALFMADVKYYMDNRFRVFDQFNWAYKGAGIFKMLGGNVLAAFKAHFIFLPAALFFYESNRLLRLFYLGTAAFTLYPILFLFSRGAYAAVFVGAAYFGWHRNKLILVLLVLVAIFWTTMLPPAVVERIEMTQDDHGDLDASAANRFDLWVTCWKMFLSSPLVGVGYDTFDLKTHRDDPHNIYMEILGEQGLIGIGLFLAMLALTFLNGGWLRRNAADPVLRGFGLATEVMVISCAITNLFGDRWSYIEISAFFFVAMALASKARVLALNESDAEEAAGPERDAGEAPRTGPEERSPVAC